MDLQILATLSTLDRNPASKGSHGRERFRSLANELDLVVRGLR